MKTADCESGSPVHTNSISLTTIRRVEDRNVRRLGVALLDNNVNISQTCEKGIVLTFDLSDMNLRLQEVVTTTIKRNGKS